MPFLAGKGYGLLHIGLWWRQAYISPHQSDTECRCADDLGQKRKWEGGGGGGERAITPFP